MNGPRSPFPGSGASQLLDLHLTRMGGRHLAATDAFAKLQVTLLRELLHLVEAACCDEGVPDDATLRIIRHVIYGATPSAAEVEYRQRLIAEQMARVETSPYLRAPWLTEKT